MTESFQPSRSFGRPEVLEKHWSSRTFSLFSSASFLGQSDPPPPMQTTPREDVCWFSELHERERRPSEHQSRGGEPCSHPSWTLRKAHRGRENVAVMLSRRKTMQRLRQWEEITKTSGFHGSVKQLCRVNQRTHLSCLFLEANALCSSSIIQLGGMGG